MQSDQRHSNRPLYSASFIGLLITQFLGAMNDNMFRWLAVPIGKHFMNESAALSLGITCFTVPFLLLPFHAGFLADRFPKNVVIIACKFAEVVIMAMGIYAVWLGNIYLLFVIVAIMGAQTALFGPAKFGSIPELLPDEKLSAGNGLMGMVTIIGSAVGFLTGNLLYEYTIDPALVLADGSTVRISNGDQWKPSVQYATYALIGTALVGWATSMLIRRLPIANISRVFTLNPFVQVQETMSSFRMLASDTALFRTALGVAFFWFLASLTQLTIDPYSTSVLGLAQKDVGILGAMLVLGVGAGSLLAGFLSGDRVELGIVPLGALGIGLFGVLLYWSGISINPEVATSAQTGMFWACIWLLGLGISAGMFNIPLEANLQHLSDVKHRGTILAASNFISFSLVLCSGGLFFLMQETFAWTASHIFLAIGLFMLPVIFFILKWLPNATIQMFVWIASLFVYRMRVYGEENVPGKGGALLVANHVSWLDGVLMILMMPRPIRFIAYADIVESWPIAWLANLFGVIPIRSGSKSKEVVRSLKMAKDAINSGDLVCIFAEGQLTRTGQIQPFQKGMMRIIKGTDAPVIPVYLDELWGSIFSFRGGKFFWKVPRRVPYPVSMVIGKPIIDPKDEHVVRDAVQELGVKAVEYRKDRERTLPRRFIRMCKRNLFRLKAADSSGLEMTGGKFLTGTLVMKALLQKHAIKPDEQNVGLLLPPSVGGALANMSVALMRKVAINLNYTLSEETLNYCIKEAGIKHVITSRKFLEQRPFNHAADVVFLEDLKPKATFFNKIFALVQAFATPAFLLERWLGLNKIKPDDLLTIVFTSGSTGTPKGVMLTQHNLLSNIDAVDQLFHLTRRDTLLGILPFFHSFGYAGNLWLAMTLDPTLVMHFNPIDARMIGRLGEKYKVTLLMATPTFLRSYLKRVQPEQFQYLDLAIVGAEKLPRELADAFQDKFHVQPAEGYGTTELSPFAAVNIPDHRAASVTQTGTKFGTVGRPLPGICVKIVDPETREPLETGQEGLLLVKGSNVMRGYLHRPDKTAEVVADGWYITGDFAKLDTDGFLTITGRQSRFSKIGGEMVPHLRVEELLCEIVAQHEATPSEEDDGVAPINLAVTAVPDAKKGERLIVVHKPLPIRISQLLNELNQYELPNIWLPSADSFIEVEQVPLLGTGKLDLKQLKELAMEHYCAAETSHN